MSYTVHRKLHEIVNAHYIYNGLVNGAGYMHDLYDSFMDIQLMS